MTTGSSLPLAFDPSVDELLSHQAFLRRLARDLVQDEDQAEDLLQQTWLRVLGKRIRGRHGSGSLRAFLARTLRNLAHDGERRRQREARALAARAAADRERTDQGLELQRQVLEWVGRLDEPYRTTLFLRYHDGLEPSAIAARSGTPVATVKTRLRRALATLRAQLHEDRPDWRRALATLVLPEQATGFGVLLMTSTTTKCGLGALALAVPLLLFYILRPGAVPDSLSAPPVLEGAEPALVAQDPSQSTGAATAAAATRQELPAEVEASEATAVILRGVVVQLDGRPVAGVPVVDAQGRALERVSDHEGRFTLPLPIEGDRVRAEDATWVTVFSGSLDAPADAEVTLVVAPRRRYGGQVLDPGGTPVAGVQVRLRLPEGVDQGQLRRPTAADPGRAWVPDYSQPESWSVESDAAGRFSLPAVPMVPGSTLRAERAGYLPLSQDAPEQDHLALRLELLRVPPDAELRYLHGSVVTPQRQPVAGALVTAGFFSTRTDPAGRFALNVTEYDTLPEITAVHPGYLPGTARPESLTGDDLVVTLGGAPLEIRGRVVDGDGEALQGMRVWIADPQPFGHFHDAEEDGSFVAQESVSAGMPRFWAYAETDRDGSFTLAGLSDREYQVACADPLRLVAAAPVPVAAGRTGVTLELRTPASAGIAGTLRYRNGAPAPGLSVEVFTLPFAMRTDYARKNVAMRHPKVYSDAEGRFVAEGVSREGARLVIEGADVFPVFRVLEDEDAGDLQFVIDRRARFRVLLAEGSRSAVDGFRVLDGAGEGLEVGELFNRSMLVRSRVPLDREGVPVLSVRETARAIVWLRGDEEVGRTPVALDPERITDVYY